MLTPQQLADRKQAIGASDMPAILLGRNSFGRTRYDVWADKTGKLDEWEGNAYTAGGNRFEPLILDMAESDLGPLARSVTVRHAGLPLASNLDGMVIADGMPVEAKAVFKPWREIVEEWGEPGSDHVPDDYLVQTHVQMMCASVGSAHLYALLNRLTPTSFVIELDACLAGMIGEAAVRFWDCVTKDVPPWDSELSPEAAKRMRRAPGKRVTIDLGLVQRWETLREARLDAEKVEKEAHGKLLVALGDAEFGEVEDLDVVSYKSQKTADTIDRAAMKADGVYDRYATGNTCRIVRVTPEFKKLFSEKD